MKRFAMGCVLAAVLLSADGVRSEESAMMLQVNSAKLMSSPSFIGTPVATVRRGQKLAVSGSSHTWLEVRTASGKTGWINKRSVAKFERAELSSEGGTSTGATGEEVDIAARGFSKDVEKQYRKNNTKLDYRHVDRIERLNVDVRKVSKFARQAGLAGSAVPAKAAGGSN